LVIDFNKGEIETYYRARVPKLITVQGKLRGPCPVHRGKDPNFSIDWETGQSYCHSQCSRGFDMLSLERELFGIDFIKAKAEVFRLIGRPLPNWQERDIEATYDYTDETGKVLYQVVRRVGKKFSQRRPDGKGGWMLGLGKDHKPVPFKLPELLKGMVVAVAEGEKDALNLMRAGWVATCNNGGAGNFRPELAPYFAGKHVAIFPDNDEPGRKHAELVAGLLAPAAASVRVVELPGLSLKGDVSDYLASGKTGSDLRTLWRETEEWTPEWKFVTEVPHENDKYLRTFAQSLQEYGGYEGFWKSLDVEGLPTPFEPLTRKLGGLRKGEVYVIAGRTGQGKTSLALQFAIAALDQRAGVLVFSMEMSHRDAFQRIAAIYGCVDLQHYRRLRREDREAPVLAQYEAALKHSTAKFCRAPLYVTTKSGVTPEFLTEESKRMIGRAPIGLAIVDHMQLMGSTGKKQTDYEKFTAISRATKEIAVELNVPLILVSQVNRSNATDRRQELEISDLRGSGAIEEDAAGILLAYYDGDDFKEAKADPQGERLKKGPIKTWLKLAKNRYGASGTYELLNHWRALTRFDPIDAQIMEKAEEQSGHQRLFEK
jgi:KaiC/GvpD/RAD55 family RecA-like ATPase